MKNCSFRILSQLLLIIVFFSTLHCREKVIINLDKAVFLAIANDPDLKISRTGLKIRNKSFFYDLRKFLPNLTLGYSNNNSIALNQPDTRSSQLSLGAECLIFDGGKIVIDYIAKKYEIEFAKRELLENTENLIHETRKKYYSLLILEEKEKLLQDVLQIALEQEDTAEFEYKNGMISQLDYYDIKLSVKQIQIDTQKAVREKENALIEFKHLIGLDENEVSLISDFTYQYIDIRDKDIAYLQNIAITNRLDLAKSRFSVYRSRVGLASTILSFLPEVTTGVEFTLSDEQFPPRNKDWSLYFDIKIPLAYLPAKTRQYMGGNPHKKREDKGDNTSVSVAENLTYENDVAQARLDMVSNSVNHHELILNIKMEIKKLVEQYLETKTIYELKKMQNDYGKKKLDIMRYKLDLGEVKRVDLLDEEKSFSNNLISEKETLCELINLESELQEKLGSSKLDIKDILDREVESVIKIDKHSVEESSKENESTEELLFEE